MDSVASCATERCGLVLVHRPGIDGLWLGFSVGQRQRYITVAEVCGLGANIPGLDLVGWVGGPLVSVCWR